MTVVTVLLALLAAVVGGAVALFTIGVIGAIAVAVLVFALAGYGLYAKGAALSAAAGIAALVFVGALAFGGYSGFQLYSGLSNTDGEVDAPDPAALASANAKLDAADGKAGFRVELTEEELTAIMQDTLASSSDNPIRRVDISIEDADAGEQGAVEFAATFKNGSLTGNGRVSAALDAGAINLQVDEVSLGNLNLPGLATGAMEDLIETVLDLNSRLEELRADVQSLEVGNGRVLITGSQAGGEILTAATLLNAIAENAESVGGAVTPPEEVIGPGSVNSTSADGSTYIVAIGDSLAANVGVSTPREGYVSRFHGAVSARDGASYGLRNLGVSGETSGTLIRSGQLDEAVAFIKANDISYITIDIGANDLLGHLGSEDCEQSISTPACQDRLFPALDAYRVNLVRILESVREAAGDDTPILFLATYNPFSLGFSGLALETASNDATLQLNGVASEVAGQFDVQVADGFTPMRGTAAATTHMLASPPDIHPNSSGYDLLAQALMSALP